MPFSNHLTFGLRSLWKIDSVHKIVRGYSTSIGQIVDTWLRARGWKPSRLWTTCAPALSLPSSLSWETPPSPSSKTNWMEQYRKRKKDKWWKENKNGGKLGTMRRNFKGGKDIQKERDKTSIETDNVFWSSLVDVSVYLYVWFICYFLLFP